MLVCLHERRHIEITMGEALGARSQRRLPRPPRCLAPREKLRCEPVLGMGGAGPSDQLIKSYESAFIEPPTCIPEAAFQHQPALASCRGDRFRVQKERVASLP